MKYALKILREFFLDHKKKLCFLFFHDYDFADIPPLFNHYSKEKENLPCRRHKTSFNQKKPNKALELNQSDLQERIHRIERILKLLLNINNEIDSSYLLRLEGELAVIADSKISYPKSINHREQCWALFQRKS